MGKVLIVDDEADIRELLSMTLQRIGLEADCAASEFEAVQLLQRCSYDLCLTDMRLPDGDGLKLLEHVTAEYGSTPVAVITAHGSTENAVAALKAGQRDIAVHIFPFRMTDANIAKLDALAKAKEKEILELK